MEGCTIPIGAENIIFELLIGYSWILLIKTQ